MSECCHDALGCRPEELCRALAIHTQKITDSCRDKDCIEDLRVYLTRESQTVLDAAGAAKVRSAELIYTTVDVTPVAFHPNHYAIDLTFFYKILADAAVSPCRPAAICGLALFSKRAILCGENSGAHIFRSDRPGNAGGNLPTAVVESAATNSRWFEVRKTYIIRQKPRLSSGKSREFFFGYLFVPESVSLSKGQNPLDFFGMCDIMEKMSKGGTLVKVYFLSIHRIIYENKQCEQITLNKGMEQFANDLLGHVLVKKNVRNYDSTDQSEPIQLAGKIRNAVDGRKKYWKKQAEGYAKKIAEHLLKAEEPFHNVQRGSLIQAVIDREDNGGTVYVLAKVAHTAFVDDAHYTTQNGFPRDEKQIWKTCILEWKESPETVKAQVFSNTEAKYWWDSFLKLTPETNNATNTRRVFETINSTMNRFFGAQKKKKLLDAECCMYDHSIIKSAFMLRLRQGTQLIYDDMINDILDKYNPLFTTPEAINELKEMLLEKSGFDKNFCLDSTELKSDYVTKISLGNGVTIGIQMDTFDLSNISVQEDGVNRILCIRYPATTAMDAYIKALLKLGEGRKQVGNKNDTE